MKTFDCRPFFALGLFLACPAHAEPADAEPIEADATEAEARAPIVDADRCPRIFGTEATHTENRKYRERALLWAEEEPSGLIDVTHSTSWKRPRRAVFPDLEVLETTEDEAIIEIGDAHSDLCPAGRYRVEVDDALGNGRQVLAVVGDVLLLESDNRLMWLAEPDRKMQDWRLVWSSWWKQPAPRISATVTVIKGGSSTRSRARSRARNRAARKRAQRQKRQKRARERRRNRRR